MTLELSAEADLEAQIRRLVSEIVADVPGLVLLRGKLGFDIAVLDQRREPRLRLLELKFETSSRLAISGRGGGIQGEVIQEHQLGFFDENLRWIIASRHRQPGRFVFLDTAGIRHFAPTKFVNDKYHSISKNLFKAPKWLEESELKGCIEQWLK